MSYSSVKLLLVLLFLFPMISCNDDQPEKSLPLKTSDCVRLADIKSPEELLHPSGPRESKKSIKKSVISQVKK